MLNVDDLETGVVVFFEKGIFHVPKEGFVSWQCDGLLMLSSIRFAKHGKVTLGFFQFMAIHVLFRQLLAVEIIVT